MILSKVLRSIFSLLSVGFSAYVLYSISTIVLGTGTYEKVVHVVEIQWDKKRMHRGRMYTIASVTTDTGEFLKIPSKLVQKGENTLVYGNLFDRLYFVNGKQVRKIIGKLEATIIMLCLLLMFFGVSSLNSNFKSYRNLKGEVIFMFLFFMKRCLSRANDFYRNQEWRYIIIATLCLYFGVYFALIWAGEKDLVENYSYFFAVTTTTVGYGDLSPTTYAGKNIVIFLLYVGVALIATVIGKIFSGVFNMAQQKNAGLSEFDIKNHILIMGYDSNVTPKLINEILGDTNRINRKIVLCSSSLEKNPFPAKDVKFVKGELDSSDVLNRSCASQASKLIVCGRDDGQSFLSAYALRQVNTHAHLVVHLSSGEHSSKVSGLPADDSELNQSILPAITGLIVQEMQDPQSSKVLQQLMSNLDGATIYRSDVPKEADVNWVFSDVFMHFRTQLDVTIIAIENNGDVVTNPSMNANITAGMSLFYIGEKREQDISWHDIS